MGDRAVYLRSVRPHAEGFRARGGVTWRIVALHARQLVSLRRLRRHYDGCWRWCQRERRSRETSMGLEDCVVSKPWGGGQIILELFAFCRNEELFLSTQSGAPFDRGLPRTLVNKHRGTFLRRIVSAWRSFS